MRNQTNGNELYTALAGHGVPFVLNAAPVERVSVTLPYPRLFADLVSQHSFGSFLLGTVRVFGNLKAEEDNIGDLLEDETLTTPLVSAGFLPFGRPADRSYDRVCFDIRRLRNPLDAPVVRMAHEPILSFGRIPKPIPIARGLVALIDRHHGETADDQ